MQIGVISDIHGNVTAFEAVRRELARSGVDEVLCLGDLIDPLPGSEKIFRLFEDEGIPILRGNHEDYVVMAAENPLDPFIADAKFKPVQLVAQTFSPEQIRRIQDLPFSLTRKCPRGREIFFCHASPKSNRHGWKKGVVDSAIVEEIRSVSAPVLVGGHWHLPLGTKWENKVLLTAGSVGVPLSGAPLPEFMILDSSSGEWKERHLTVKYDLSETLAGYTDSGWLERGAPISLLYFLEIATGQRALSTLFPWCEQRDLRPSTTLEWSRAVADYLRETGRWILLESLIEQFAHRSLEEILAHPAS